jgi:flagellar basal-body rod protein FlgC
VAPRFHLKLKALYPPTALFALMLSAAGCSEDERHVSEPPPVTVPSPGRSPVSSSTALLSAGVISGQVPPLRRTSQTSAGDADGFSALDLNQLKELIAFQATKTPAGTVIHAHALVTADEQIKPALAALQALGFKADGSAGAPIWTCTISPDGRPAFDVRLNAELQSASAQLEAAAQRLRGNQPGRLISRDDGKGYLPRRLVYTGHPLDIAFADSESGPRWFIAVKLADGTRGYLRGGRLYVGEDGALRIEKYPLGVELPSISKDTEQVTVGKDGRIMAVHRDGSSGGAGRLPLVYIDNFQNEKVTLSDDGVAQLDGERAPAYDLAVSEAPLRPGHLEYPAPDRNAELRKVSAAVTTRRALEALSVTLANPAAVAKAGDEPLVIYADIPWTERHLKTLGIPVEHSTGHTTLMMDGDPRKLASALAKVLQVLRLRLSIHEQNLRNADRVRDTDNRLNPYRRKTLTIDAQGEAVEGEDPAPFPKTFKPGDPNADAEGFISLPNVNRAVETAEFQAAREEYKLLRAAAERLEPRSIFPEPPALPQKE